MDSKLILEVKAIEKELEADPSSSVLWFQLFQCFLGEKELFCHSIRMKHILQYIKLYPKGEYALTPYVQIDPELSPTEYQELNKIWTEHLENNVEDIEIARGAANHYCMKNRNEAKDILKGILKINPNEESVWLDLARYSIEAEERLEYFQNARKYGSTQPNLLVWIATTAIKTQKYDIVESIANELLVLMQKARDTYGDKLDWKGTNHDRQDKAYELTGDRKSSFKLTQAISTHYYHKHNAYNALGHVALSKNDINTATQYLIQSAEVASEPRLSSYGPSFSLAKELCKKEQWTEVEKYLNLCSLFWEDEILTEWTEIVKNHKVPEFKKSED